MKKRKSKHRNENKSKYLGNKYILIGVVSIFILLLFIIIYGGSDTFGQAIRVTKRTSRGGTEVYTKAEIDQKLSDIYSNTYTKVETDRQITNLMSTTEISISTKSYGKPDQFGNRPSLFSLEEPGWWDKDEVWHPGKIRTSYSGADACTFGVRSGTCIMGIALVERKSYDIRLIAEYTSRTGGRYSRCNSDATLCIDDLEVRSESSQPRTVQTTTVPIACDETITESTPFLDTGYVEGQFLVESKPLELIYTCIVTRTASTTPTDGTRSSKE